MIMELLNDHITNSRLPRRRSSRNPCSDGLNQKNSTQNKIQKPHLQYKREDQKIDLPITKGCFGAARSAAVKAEEVGVTDAERGDGREEAEERRASRRRPEKWGPDAASMT